MARQESIRVLIQQLWYIALVQEGIESWMQTWLVPKFRSSIMCREVVKDGRWCKVPSVTLPMMQQVPEWKCSYDPWCGAVVYSETAPNLLIRLTVLLVALLTSLIVVWSPRLLTYRPTNPIIFWIRRNTPRIALMTVAAGAILQMGLDHFFLPLVLPHTILLTRTVSIITFFSTTAFMTAVMVLKIKQNNLHPYSTQKLEYSRREKSPLGSKKEKDYWEEHTNTYRASYVLPDDFRNVVSDNLI